MKKFSLMLVLMSALAFTFQSCGNDDSGDDTAAEPKPAVTLKAGADYTSGDVTVEGGTEIKFGVTVVNHSVNLKSLTVAKVVGSNTQVLKDSTLSGKTLDFEMSVLTPNVSATEVYQISVTDKNGQTGIASFAVTTTAQGGGKARVLTTALGNKNSTVPSCYSISTGQTFSFSGGEALNNSGLIDIMFYYNDNNEPVIAGPTSANAQAHYSGTNGPANWATKNATDLRFTSISKAEFDAIVDQGDDAKIIAEASTGSYSNEITNIEEGDRFVIRSANGVNAICEITGLTGSQAQPGEVSLTVKVQEKQ